MACKCQSKVVPVGFTAKSKTPSKAYRGDAGLDLPTLDNISIPPLGRKVVDTGIRIAIPEGNVGLVSPRSGLASKLGITVLNAPGIVDSGYRGTIKVTLLNTDPKNTVKIKERKFIAQLVIVPLLRFELVKVDRFDKTERGERGLGSSDS